MASDGDAAQPTFSKRSDITFELTVGFYNVGIHLLEVDAKKWETKERLLKQDIIKAKCRLLEPYFYHEANTH